jgi:hypothetical protein
LSEETDEFAVVTQVRLGFVDDKNFTPCQVYKSTKLTFQLGYFAFGTLSTDAPCVPDILLFGKPKSCRFFKKKVSSRSGRK